MNDVREQRKIQIYRAMLEKGNWLRYQPLSCVQSQSLHLKDGEQLYVDTVRLDSGEIGYNIQLQKKWTWKSLLKYGAGIVSGFLFISYLTKKFFNKVWDELS